MAVFTIYKPVGLTPLQAANKFKEENPEYSNQKISYAGRLDPLARGKMTLLTGKDRFDAKKYQDMDKVYYFKIIFGFSTDSYDLLGIPNKINLEKIDTKKIKKFTKKYRGKIRQKYPPFSAKTVRGKKLFWWARQNRLGEIEIPTKDVEIYKLEYLKNDEIDEQRLLKNIIEKIDKVNGDFRQKEIKNRWRKLFNESKRNNYEIYKFRVYCSSGTYVRTIAYKLGEELGTSAVCVDIHRTNLFYPLRDDSSRKERQ